MTDEIEDIGDEPTPEETSSNDAPTVTELTDELIETVISTLEAEGDVGSAALGFVKAKKGVLIGLAAEPFLDLLRSVGDGGHDAQLAAKRAFIKTLPTAALVNSFHEESIEALEQSAHPQLVLGSFLRTLANTAVDVAPRLLGVLTAVL